MDDEDGYRQLDKPEAKMKNEALLLNLARQTGGTVFPIHEALSLLAHFAVKRVRPSTLYRGPLLLGSIMENDVGKTSVLPFL